MKEMEELNKSLNNLNSNNSLDTFLNPFWVSIIEITVILILVLICVTANCLLSLIILTNRNLRTPSNLFCINLSLTDFLIGGGILPFWAAATCWQAWNLPTTLCMMMAFMSIVLMTSSTLTLAAISVDRYLWICHPLHYPSLVSYQKVQVLIFFIWVICFFLASMPFWGWGEYKFRPQKIPICSSVFTGYIGYSSVLWTVVIVVPVVIIFCSYCLILKAVKKQVQRIGMVEFQMAPMPKADTEVIKHSQNQKNKNHSRSMKFFFYRHKSIRTVFTVIGTFFTCWVPYAIVNVWSLSSSSSNSEVIPYTLNLLTTFLAFSNSSINPILLLSLNKDYKTGFANILAKIRMTCHPSS